MIPMTIATDTDRSLIAVRGADAEHLLHNVLTANIETLEPGNARACALLSPQGKVLFDFLIMRADAGFLIDIRTALAEPFMQRMKLYKLRADVEFSVCPESLASIVEESESDSSRSDSGLVFVDTRFSARRVLRAYDQTGSQQVHDALHRWRIVEGIAESGADFEAGDPFAHDIGLDNRGGVDLAKGCYVGQEVVSRMHHRGTARKRPVIVEGAGLAAGATLMAGNRPAGTLGTSTGALALCIARLDRLRSAMDGGEPLSVDAMPVSVRLPDGAIYHWPQQSGGDDDG